MRLGRINWRALPARRTVIGEAGRNFRVPSPTPHEGTAMLPRIVTGPVMVETRLPAVTIMLSTWSGLLPLKTCLLYTSDAADERSSVDLGGRRIIKKKK